MVTANYKRVFKDSDRPVSNQILEMTMGKALARQNSAPRGRGQTIGDEQTGDNRLPAVACFQI